MIRKVFNKAKRAPKGSRFKIPSWSTAGMLTTLHALLRARPDLVLTVGPWPGREMTAAQWFAWFREKLDLKILSHDPRRPPENRRQEEYDIALNRMRPYIGTRLVVHSIDQCLGFAVLAAFSTRMSDPDLWRSTVSLCRAEQKRETSHVHRREAAPCGAG